MQPRKVLLKRVRPRRLRQRGFFIPHRHADKIAVVAASGYPALAPLFAGAEPAMHALLDTIDGYATALLAIDPAAPPPAPRFRQDWFPRLDALAAYAIVRARCPARLVEVGCGHSTRWFARAIADASLSSRLTAIDPRPRAALADLPVVFLRTTLQRAGGAPFANLQPGDVLSLDGSHILMPGTDVDIMLNRILPELPPGMLLHIHDVFLPDPYPAHWSWRGYNEQQAVGAMLAGGGWRILWASRWVATRLNNRLACSVAVRLPLLPGAYETSLWLEKQ